MSPRKTAIATGITVALLATGLSPPGAARAADTGEVQDLKRQVSELRAEIQALQVVLAEATELERQRSVNLTRAVKESATPPPSAPAGSGEPASGAPEPARPVVRSPAVDDKDRSAPARHRRHRHSPRSRSKLR